MKVNKILFGLIGLLFVLNIGFSANYSLLPSYAANIVVEQTKYDPFPATPGEYVKIWIKVENWGGEDLLNSVFQLKTEYPFSLDPGDDGIQIKGRIGSLQQVLL